MIRVVFSYGPTCLCPSCPQAELSGTRLAYQSLAFDKTHVFFFFFWYTVYHRPPMITYLYSKISVSILNKILNHKRNHLHLQFQQVGKKAVGRQRNLGLPVQKLDSILECHCSACIQFCFQFLVIYDLCFILLLCVLIFFSISF